MSNSKNTDVKRISEHPPATPCASPCDALFLRRRTMWVSILEGSFTFTFMTWTSGAVLIGYLLALGAGPRTLAAVASMPMLVQLFSPAMSWWAARRKRRLVYMQVVTGLGRGLWVFAIVLPWLPPLGIPPALLLVALVGLSGLLQSGVGPAWISLMGDVVPDEIRGRYFGLRNGILGIVAMVASVAAGLYLDRTAAPGNFQMVLFVSVCFALVGIVMYGWHYDPPHARPDLSLWESIRTPLRDRAFRRFLGFSMYWNAAVLLGSPFVIPYFLKHLGMTFTQVAIWSAISAICTFGTAPLWGRLADQVGHKTVLTITSILAGTALPACWLIARPGWLAFIWISSVMDSLSWGGANTSLFNMGLNAAPVRYRMSYLAILGAAGGITGCIAALASGPLLELFTPWTFTLGDYQWTGYHTLFVISAAMRAFAWRLLRGIPEPPRRPLGEVLREFAQRGVSLLPRIGPNA